MCTKTTGLTNVLKEIVKLEKLLIAIGNLIQVIRSSNETTRLTECFGSDLRLVEGFLWQKIAKTITMDRITGMINSNGSFVDYLIGLDLRFNIEKQLRQLRDFTDELDLMYDKFLRLNDPGLYYLVSLVNLLDIAIDTLNLGITRK